MPDTSQRKNPVVPLFIATVAVLVVAGLVLIPMIRDSAPSKDSAAAVATQSETQKYLSGFIRRDADDAMALGKVDAPVVLVNYSEFQCPFCGKFARDTEPTLVEKYVKDGTLRIEWRDFPYLGKESTLAAHAGRAAAAQGKFWEFNEAMFANQPSPNSGTIDKEYLSGIAKRLGLVVADFQRDLRSEHSAAAAEKDFMEGQSFGVNGTPTFVVNGRLIVGAQPTEVFEQMIEEEAAAAR